MTPRFLMPLLAALAVLPCATPAAAQDMQQASPQATEDYAKFMKANFYLLDDQNFSRITCKVRAPIIDKALDSARQQFQAVPGNIEIDENLKDFSLVYDKTQGFSFTKPIFGFKANDPENVRDAQEFSEGTEKMKDDLRTMVDSVIDGIKGLFDEYTVGGQKKILAFEKTSTGAVVTLAVKGVVTKSTFANGGRSSEIAGADMTGNEVSEFGTMNDRLLFTKSTGHIQSSTGNMDITVSVKYDKAGSIVFPTKIYDTTIMVINGVNQDTKINIFLDNCTAQ